MTAFGFFVLNSSISDAPQARFFLLPPEAENFEFFATFWSDFAVKNEHFLKVLQGKSVKIFACGAQKAPPLVLQLVIRIPPPCFQMVRNKGGVFLLTRVFLSGIPLIYDGTEFI